MRVHRIITHLRPEEACTLVEFLDQLREVLMRTYGDDITTMLKEASQDDTPADYREKDEAF